MSGKRHGDGKGKYAWQEIGEISHTKKRQESARSKEVKAWVDLPEEEMWVTSLLAVLTEGLVKDPKEKGILIYEKPIKDVPGPLQRHLRGLQFGTETTAAALDHFSIPYEISPADGIAGLPASRLVIGAEGIKTLLQTFDPYGENRLKSRFDPLRQVFSDAGIVPDKISPSGSGNRGGRQDHPNIGQHQPGGRQ